MIKELLQTYPLLFLICFSFLVMAVTWLFNEWRFQKRLNWKLTIDGLKDELTKVANLIENLFTKYSGHEGRIDSVEKKQGAVMARIDAVEERCHLHREFTNMKHRFNDAPDANFSEVRRGVNEKDGTDAT